MLLAELHGKVAHQFECPACGGEVSPAGQLGIEDALTSYVFGSLRHIPPEVGILPVLRAADVKPGPAEDFDIALWPFATVRVTDIGKSEPAAIGVEPDVVVTGGGLVICIEAKLGSVLGADPLQLPKEIVHVAQEARAKGMDWRLVCLTNDRREPRLKNFQVVAERLEVGGFAKMSDAVASYFSVVPVEAGPTHEEVRSRVSWISWSSIFEALTAAEAQAPPWTRRAILDLGELLTKKGLVLPKFHGFVVPLSPLPDGLLPIWRQRTPEHALWDRMTAAILPESLPRLWSQS